MKKLIELTVEDALKVVNAIHVLTHNSFVDKHGTLGLSFEESYRKYGDASMEFLIESIDGGDGHFSFSHKMHIKFHHQQLWFEEYDSSGEVSNYNKNHIYGYDKLRELGYSFPDKPGIV